VRRLTAAAAILALLLATIYAPLFHVHAGAGEAPLLHAHFPELETPEDESVVHMEAGHSHADARSIDVLTTIAPDFCHCDVVIQTAYLIPDTPDASRGFVKTASARAHAPPVFRSLIPRAPPA
jgi:hypothetical protein